MDAPEIYPVVAVARALGICISLALWGAFIGTASPLGAQERAQRVVMLHSYSYANPGTTISSDAARKRLLERSQDNIKIDADFLDLVRVADPEHELRMATFLRDKYAQTSPGVIVSLGAAAFPFIVKYRDYIAPKVPVVFAGVSHAHYESLRPPPDVTEIIIDLDLDKTLSLAERLQPNARRLYIIAGSARVDRLWQATARKIVESRARKFETTYLFELPLDSLVAEVSKVPSDAIVVILTVFIDGDGQIRQPAEVTTAVTAVSRAPVYSPYHLMLGMGVVGGFSETFESIGIAVADLAMEILAGKDVATIPPRSNPEQAYRVDFKAMQRWNLREANLPGGTVVMFKDPSIWEGHRNFVLGVLAIFALQTGVAGALLVERRRRQVAELESRRRLTEVALMNRNAAAGAMSASIAHELNQPLGAILSNAEAAELILAQHPLDTTQLKEILSDIRQADQRAGDIIKRIRALLKRTEIEKKEVHLGEAMQAVLHILDAEVRKRGVVLSSENFDGTLRVRADLVHLEQILLNLALNGMDAMAATAPGARTITFQTGLAGDGTVEISVIDTGTGIPPDKLDDLFEPFFTTKPQGLGLGLSIVRTIVESYGGRIWAENRAGAGAAFHFSLPLIRTPPT